MSDRPKRLIEFVWRDRHGIEHRAQYYGGSIDKARVHAEKEGYPGHSGQWWRYLIDDVRALIARFR